MRIEEFSETLPQLLHAELDEFPVPERGWMAARPDLRRRVRRRRAHQAAAGTAAMAAIAAVLISAGGLGIPGRGPAPAGPARLTQLASRSFGGNPAPQPAADLTYGDGRLFAIVYGQRMTPLLRLDPVSLRVTGRLQAGRGIAPVFGDGSVWVSGGSHDSQVWRIDPVTLRVTRRIQVGGQLTALAFSEGTLWLTFCPAIPGNGLCLHHRQRLERIDPASGNATGSSSLPIASTSVDLAAGRVILASGENSPVLAIDPRTLAVLQTFHINCDGCGGATGVTVGPGGLYAVSGNRVVRLGLTSGRVITQGPQLPFNAGTLAVAPGSLWLCTEVGTFRLDPVTLAPTARVIAASQDLLGTGDTEHAVVVGRSVYVSYSGGLARYSGPASR